MACANARHEGCARACIEGLGERGRELGREMSYIHVSFHPICHIPLRGSDVMARHLARVC